MSFYEYWYQQETKPCAVQQYRILNDLFVIILGIFKYLQVVSNAELHSYYQ
jgi:hypothetical protein